jgi:hypothetical protein
MKILFQCLRKDWAVGFVTLFLVSSPNAHVAQLPTVIFGKYPKMSNSTPASLASWLT